MVKSQQHNNLNLKKIHEDDRGIIYLMKGTKLNELEEVTIFFTKKGFARGGCIHNENNEYSSVLEGEVHFYLGDKPFPWQKMKKGDTIKIPRGTPHYFVAKTDCLVMEWGATEKEKQKKHKKTREKVLKINEEAKEVG